MLSHLKFLFTVVTILLTLLTFQWTYISQRPSLAGWNFFLSVFYFGIVFTITNTNNSLKWFRDLQRWLISLHFSATIYLIWRTHASEMIREYGPVELSNGDRMIVYAGCFMNLFHHYALVHFVRIVEPPDRYPLMFWIRGLWYD